MKHGIHLANVPELSAECTSLIKRGGFDLAKGMTEVNSLAHFDRVRALGIEDWILRIWHSGQPPDPCTYVEDKLPELKRVISGPLRSANVIVEIHNEPNELHLYEGFGPGLGAEFQAWYLPTLFLLRDELDVPFCFPGLAVGDAHNDREFYELNADAMDFSNYIGVHSYWQGGHELDPTWGLRYETYGFDLSRVIVTEYGDSSYQNPMFDASPAARAERIARWLEHAKTTCLYGAVFFILPGHDSWSGFALDELTADAMKEAMS